MVRPPARSDRAYNWGDSAIAPDAVGHLFAGSLHVPFYFEYELRARHPRGVLARLRPYTRYYHSNEPGEDQPPYPVTLFVVATEEVEDTYVRTHLCWLGVQNGTTGPISEDFQRPFHSQNSYETGLTYRPDVSGSKMGTCAKIRGHEHCTFATP